MILTPRLRNDHIDEQVDLDCEQASASLTLPASHIQSIQMSDTHVKALACDYWHLFAFNKQLRIRSIRFRSYNTRNPPT
jgi:hypothetical protein